MNDKKILVYEGMEVPESITLKIRQNLYGTVEGLDDEELADPEELEQQVLKEMYEPIWRIPYERRTYNPVYETHGTIESNAFATIDFERISSKFEKAKYKKDKLKEELKHVLIMMEIIKERLPRAKYLVLKYLRMGIIEIEHIEDQDMYSLGKVWMS